MIEFVLFFFLVFGSGFGLVFQIIESGAKISKMESFASGLMRRFFRVKTYGLDDMSGGHGGASLAKVNKKNPKKRIKYQSRSYLE